MKRRPRRKAGADRDEEDNASSCSTPTKDKENLSPSTKGRQSVDVYQQQFLALLANFDQNVAMTKKEMLSNGQLMAEKLTLPFCTALMKMPHQIKNMKWGDYLKLRANSNQATSSALSTIIDKHPPETQNDMHNFAVPSAKMETPALRSSSRLAKNKLPIITPKFDPSTPATINKRLPKPGEMLVSLKGSPVAVPNQTTYTIRGMSSLAAGDDSDKLVALLNNPETLNNALKDKNALKAFMKAYNSKMRKE